MATDNDRWTLLWRLSANSTLTRKHLFALGIPPPNIADYKTYSQLLAQSQGGQSRQGYINIPILWDLLDFSQLQTLVEIVDAAITAGAIYATVPKDNGSGLNAFVDIHGIATPVTYQPVSHSSGLAASNVTFTINAVVVDADPSAII